MSTFKVGSSVRVREIAFQRAIVLADMRINARILGQDEVW